MHIEFLIEDSSGLVLLQKIIPQIIGENGDPHTYRFHSYKGSGRIRPDFTKHSIDPAKRVLLDRLEELLPGFDKTPGIDAVVIVVDSDDRDTTTFLGELQGIGNASCKRISRLFCLAIEEIEAWYFGDRDALLSAYPNAKKNVIEQYKQDSICGTWEKLADATYPGGQKKITNITKGHLKHEWARNISPLLDISRNISPSFIKFRTDLNQLARQ